jgi:hypothetical protein
MNAHPKRPRHLPRISVSRAVARSVGRAGSPLACKTVNLATEVFVRTRQYDDDWTIDRWRLEPRVRALDFEEPRIVEQTPPLWKDLTVASIAAALLWAAAALVFG